ncbi:hypothetical protein SBDP1_320036 [Syntrophobacter sp. SbD1]|nr:hypothetical protein SBDP1_320036 [Syntrophobacter sp. SbD1]
MRSHSKSYADWIGAVALIRGAEGSVDGKPLVGRLTGLAGLPLRGVDRSGRDDDGACNALRVELKDDHVWNRPEKIGTVLNEGPEQRCRHNLFSPYLAVLLIAA